MTLFAAPPNFALSVTTERPDGSKQWREVKVVAFDDSGTPWVAGRSGLESAYHLGYEYSLEEVDERLPPVAAAPGWYALFGEHSFGSYTTEERYPVLAWRGSTDCYGGTATILVHTENEAFEPCDADKYAAEYEGYTLIGYFHQEWHPEEEHHGFILRRMTESSEAYQAKIARRLHAESNV